MEYVLYILIVISLYSNGQVKYHRPVVYTMEAQCEFKKVQVSTILRSKSSVGFTATCVEVKTFSEAV